MNNYLEIAMENLKLEMTLKMIEAAGEGTIPETIGSFLRILVNHGCPADAALESLLEYADKMHPNEKEDAHE